MKLVTAPWFIGKFGKRINSIRPHFCSHCQVQWGGYTTGKLGQRPYACVPCKCSQPTRAWQSAGQWGSQQGSSMALCAKNSKIVRKKYWTIVTKISDRNFTKRILPTLTEGTMHLGSVRSRLETWSGWAKQNRIGWCPPYPSIIINYNFSRFAFQEQRVSWCQRKVSSVYVLLAVQ